MKDTSLVVFFLILGFTEQGFSQTTPTQSTSTHTSGAKRENHSSSITSSMSAGKTISSATGASAIKNLSNPTSSIEPQTSATAEQTALSSESSIEPQTSTSIEPTTLGHSLNATELTTAVSNTTTTTFTSSLPLKFTTPKATATTINPLGEERILECLQEGLKLFAQGESLQGIMKGLVVKNFTSTLTPLVQDIINKGMPLMMSGPSSELLKVVMSDFTKIFAKTNMLALLQRVANIVLNKLEPSLLRIPNVSRTCMYSLDAFLHGVINGDDWALAMLDAAGKPSSGILKGGSLWIGNKDECETVRYAFPNQTVVMKVFSSNQTVVMRGQYTNVFTGVPEKLLFRLTQGEQIAAGYELQWDVCLPDYCSSDDLAVLSQMIVGLLHFKVNGAHTVEPHIPISEDNNAIIALTVLFVIFFFTLCAIICDAVIAHKRQKDENVLIKAVNGSAYVNDASTNDDGNVKDGKTLEDSSETETQKFSTFEEEEHGTLAKLLLSFSFPRNLEKILDTSVRPGDVPCLHGIRVLSMGYIMLGNTCYFLFNKNVFENGVDILMDLRTYLIQIVINATFATDTFFLLGGTLICYWFLRDTKKRGGLSLKQIIFYYTHRIWRLTPFYALTIMIYYCLYPYFLNGPFDVKEDPDIINCGETWWTNLLYINNFYKSTTQCMVWTWYSACDMQFYVIAPFILVPLVLFKMVGFVLICGLILVHLITTGIFEYKYGGNIMNPGSPDGDYFQYVFIKPYTRVAPFAIGLLLGYILHNKNKFKLHKIVAAFGWILSIGLTFLFTTVTYDNNKDFPKNWSRMGETFYQVFSRPLWAISVAWMIVACVKGCGGPINSFLSWKGWAPLSRLTYAAYLGHPLMIALLYYNSRAVFYYNTQTLMFNYFSVFMLTYGVSLAASVLLEAPCRCLKEVFFPRDEDTSKDDDEETTKKMSNSNSVFLELKE